MQRTTIAFAAAGLALAFTTITAPSALADSGNAAATFGQLYHDGDVVRTVVTPAAIPGMGVDAIFAVPDGVAGQLAITSAVPGAPGTTEVAGRSTSSRGTSTRTCSPPTKRSPPPRPAATSGSPGRQRPTSCALWRAEPRSIFMSETTKSSMASAKLSCICWPTMTISAKMVPGDARGGERSAVG